MARWNLLIEVETDEDPNNTEYTLAEIVEDGQGQLLSAMKKED